MVDATALKGGNILGGMGLKFGSGSLGTILLWVIVIMVLIGAITGFIVWWISKKSWNKKVWIFVKVAGVPMLKLIDTGKLISFGMAGDKLMKLKTLKKWLPPPQIQMGKDIYWYYEREDGEFVNFSLEDLDERQRKAGAYFVDTDMRMQRLGIEKNLRDRMEKKSWLEKYGSVIAGAVFIIMVTVCLVVLFSKLKETSTSIDGMASNVGKLADAVEKFYTKKVGGESPADVNSGLVPALMFPIIYWRSKKWHKKFSL
jgi:NADH:ubiquinone oxidoreductase subunit 6 (subunit J)